MRCATLAFNFLAIAATVFAADPFAGTWKLNSEKTKYKKGEAPRDQTVIIAEPGPNLDVRIKGTAADGTPISAHYTVPTAGGEGKVIESSFFDAVSMKRDESGRQVITHSKGGKVVRTVDATVSKDGLTMTAEVEGTDSDGKPIVGVAVYDRQ